jgi:hypothetical protein
MVGGLGKGEAEQEREVGAAADEKDLPVGTEALRTNAATVDVFPRF